MDYNENEARATWERRTELMAAMQKLMYALNEEDMIRGWLMCGVPDDAIGLDAIRQCYPMPRGADEEDGARDEFDDVAGAFCRCVLQACHVRIGDYGNLKYDVSRIFYAG